MVFAKDHFTKDCPCLVEVQQYVKGHAYQPTILTNPFHPQKQQMVATYPMPFQRKNIG